MQRMRLPFCQKVNKDITLGSARKDTAFRNNSCRSGEEDMAVGAGASGFGPVQIPSTTHLKAMLRQQLARLTSGGHFCTSRGTLIHQS